MDLSQQELPLTTYFSRGYRDSRSRVVTRNNSQDNSQSVARSLKRKRNDVRCSPASPSSNSIEQSQLHPTSMQLPTPAVSTRKRMSGGHLKELSDKSQIKSTGAASSSVKHDTTLLGDKDLAQLKFGPTPLKCSSSRGGAISKLPLATPATNRRKTTKPMDTGSFPDSRLSHHIDTGIVTPRTSSRRVSEPRHCIDHSPLVYSKRSLPSKRKSSVSLPWDGTSVPPPKTTDGQPSNGHVIPMLPISSSQSQYLLHLDATPRKQRSQRIEHVISSQTQEERELTLSPSLQPVPMVSLSIEQSLGKHIPRANAETRLSCDGRDSQYAYVLGSSPVGSPINTPSRPSRPFALTKGSDGLESNRSSPSRRKILTSYHSPSRKTKSPRKFTRHDSIENIPPVHIEDSVTESESDVDILQVPRHPPVPRDGCPSMHRGFAQGNLPSMEDGSTTEAESDTEILHCVAEIGKNRPCQHRSEVSKDVPPPPLISPLVSPIRSRIAAMPPIVNFAQLSAQEGASSSVQGSDISYSTATERPHTRSESLPSIVRDFITMFSGDESYPADFPESLRI